MYKCLNKTLGTNTEGYGELEVTLSLFNSLAGWSKACPIFICLFMFIVVGCQECVLTLLIELQWASNNNKINKQLIDQIIKTIHNSLTAFQVCYQSLIVYVYCCWTSSCILTPWNNIKVKKSWSHFLNKQTNHWQHFNSVITRCLFMFIVVGTKAHFKGGHSECIGLAPLCNPLIHH